uniref:Endothelin-converting enzyme n=1 Tax=Rhipicephalus appendiculatus TaxID=34631 RepID=A0A131YWW6_RHIAP
MGTGGGFVTPGGYPGGGSTRVTAPSGETSEEPPFPTPPTGPSTPWKPTPPTPSGGPVGPTSPTPITWGPGKRSTTPEKPTSGPGPDTRTYTFTSKTRPANVPPGDYYVCTTDYCEAEGTFVSSVLSETTKPCDDFYDHVCNKFQAEHTVNLQNADIISTDTLLFRAMEDSMKSIITGRQPGTDKLYNLYNGCRDTSSKSSGNTNKEFNSIKDDAGLSGWPYADSSDASDYDGVWTAAAKMCRLLGVHALAKLTVEPDPEEVDKFVVALDEPDVFLRKSDVHLNKMVNWYTEAVTTSLKEGAKIAGVADASNHASSVVTFAKNLVKSLSLPDKTIMGTDRYMTKMSKEIPMKMQKYVGIVVDMGNHPSSMRDNSRILLKSPTFINKTLGDLVQNQPSYVVLNYLGFRMMVELSPYLPDSVSVLRNVWYTQFTGIYKPNVERWRACLHSIDRAVPLYLLYMYSEHLNKTSFREVVARMTTDKIGRTFAENINRTKWMDGFTRYIAERKIMSQKILSFYPVWVAIKDKFLDHIAQLPAATGTDAIKQYFTYVQHFRDDIFKAYTTQKARMKQWPGSVFDTDVLYDILRQAVFIPMGLFNTSVPTNSSVFVVHSARYGVRLTRAMTRMIYEKSYYYDTGKVFPEMVWSETSAQNFAKKLQCFTDQYSALDDPNNPGQKLNGSTVRESVFEESAAITPAFKAFHQLLNVFRIWQRDFRLMNAEHLSSDKLFFIYYVLDNCVKANQDYMMYQMYGSNKAFVKERVMLALKNSREFSRVFGCQEGSPMNPQQKCIAWGS